MAHSRHALGQVAQYVEPGPAHRQQVGGRIFFEGSFPQQPGGDGANVQHRFLLAAVALPHGQVYHRGQPPPVAGG
ncbi:hypothetical protein HNQ92_003032 [Rhabdobacter roseus]|uniref:Uncharacterized protein n=1 Tax=Rhabdobacter roseus TaxID=1655419 RepID=A0A840TNE8_9BACT|nr:hypothetical protein [Rhabdobacter roseus]MBB5284884.1 hypothetical protein [Rhabdobacter roseus]